MRQVARIVCAEKHVRAMVEPRLLNRRDFRLIFQESVHFVAAIRNIIRVVNNRVLFAIQMEYLRIFRLFITELRFFL